MDFKTIKGRKHYIYDSIHEFRIHNPEIPVRHYWRDGCEGEWVFTDDDFVCEILRRLTVRGGNNKKDCVRTVCGTFVCSFTGRKMLGEAGVAENIYSFSGNFYS